MNGKEQWSDIPIDEQHKIEAIKETAEKNGYKMTCYADMQSSSPHYYLGFTRYHEK